jgi:hypothetical protein
MVGSAAVTHPAILSQGCGTIGQMVKKARRTIACKVNGCGRRVRQRNSSESGARAETSKTKRRVMTDRYAHHDVGEIIPGVTRDPVLRPVSSLMVAIGVLWLLFWGMALEAGTLDQPKCAAALIVLGLLLGAMGKPGEQN